MDSNLCTNTTSEIYPAGVGITLTILLPFSLISNTIWGTSSPKDKN